MAGPVESEAPGVGRSAVAEPAELEDSSVGLASVDVGEVGPEANLDAGEVRPAVPGVALRRWVRLALVDAGGAFIDPSWPAVRQAATVSSASGRWVSRRSSMATRSRLGETPIERTGGVRCSGPRNDQRRSARAARSAKSAGLITLRWMTEKTTSIWFSHEAWTGRWTSRAFGPCPSHPFDRTLPIDARTRCRPPRTRCRRSHRAQGS